MNNNNHIKAFVTHLEQEILWVSELNRLLATEKETLSASRFSELDHLANQKQTLSEKLETSANERVQLLKTATAKKESASFIDLFKHCSALEVIKINQLNNQLAEKLMLCKELNAVNGQVISNNLHTRQEMINVLSGQQNNTTPIYNASGDVKTAMANTHHQKA